MFKRRKTSWIRKTLWSLIENCVKKNTNIIGFKIGEEPKQSLDKIYELYNDFKMKNKNNDQFIEI